jgi:hypothetical protein
MQAGYDGSVLKLRIPFSRRAQDRKLVPCYVIIFLILIIDAYSMLISAPLFIIMFFNLGLNMINDSNVFSFLVLFHCMLYNCSVVHCIYYLLWG